MPTDMHQLPREEFIERNLGLVHACAGRFKGRGIEYEELYAAGCLGLVKACDGFDTGRGVCFSTYAVPVILGEIKKLFRDGGTVKVSRSLKELSLKINAERERCLKRTGQEPGVTELAETLGISQPNATYKLNQLIQKGYVEKVPSTADRRELHLHVTDKYMRYWNESSSTMHRALDLLQQRFSDGELAVFSRMLQVLADTLSASGTDL